MTSSIRAKEEAGENTGYIAKTQASKWRITSKPKTDEGGSSSGSSGGGGGSSWTPPAL